MEIKLEHVLLLLFMVILFYFANNVEGVYDPTCYSSKNDEYSMLCRSNPNCEYHWANTGSHFRDWLADGSCVSKDPRPLNQLEIIPRISIQMESTNRCIQDESGICDFNCPHAGNDCCFSSDSYQVNHGLVTVKSCNDCLRSYNC
jgi:hypothetical protein